VLAARAAHDAPLDNPFGIARLLRTLRNAGADEAVSALLARRPAEHTALSGLSGFKQTVTTLNAPFGVAGLLRALRDAHAVEAAFALAARAAHSSPVDDPREVQTLLAELRYMRAEDAFSTLASRAASNISFNDSGGVAGLLKTMRYGGADEAASALAARAANAGLWELSSKADPEKARQYKFGRQPDGAASAPWKWLDLTD
jgi:hypothetical protein